MRSLGSSRDCERCSACAKTRPIRTAWRKSIGIWTYWRSFSRWIPKRRPAMCPTRMTTLPRSPRRRTVHGFASVDPHKGEQAVDELERAVSELGLKGLKLHPIHQAFFPSDDAFRPLFDKCEELGVPVLIHSGYAAAGAGTPGGGGFKLKYARPIPYIDDLAADHPADHHHGPPRLAVGRRAGGGGPPQAERLHRSVRLGAAVHPPGTHPRGEHTPAGQGAIRLRLPVHAAVEMAARVRGTRNAGRAEAKSPAGQRQARAWAVARVRVNWGASN